MDLKLLPFVLLGGSLGAIMNICVKGCSKNFPPQASLACMFLFGGIIYLARMKIMGTFPSFRSAPASSIAYLIGAIITCTVLNLNNFELMMRAKNLAIPFTLITATSGLLSFFFASILFHSEFTWVKLVGILLVFAGGILVVKS